MFPHDCGFERFGLKERVVATQTVGGISSFLIREEVTWQQRPWPASLAR